MAYTILCTFRPGAFAHAKPIRLSHYEFLAVNRPAILEGGPLLGPDGIPTGMLMVVDTPTLEGAQAFIAQEPYNKSGLFESVAIRKWSHVVPEPTPGYINGELAREREAAK